MTVRVSEPRKVRLARFELWLAAVLCGVSATWSVFAPVVNDGTWDVMAAVPSTRGILGWAAALILGAAAAAIGPRPPAVTPAHGSPRTPIRWRLALIALPYLVAVIVFQEGETFTLPAAIGWIGLVVIVVLMFVPDGWRPQAAFLEGWHVLRRGIHADIPFVLGFAAVLVVALTARLHDLAAVPPELNHDQIEKIVDTQRILDGFPAVFFAGNGGREPLHFYFLALLSPLTGGVNRALLHVGAIAESVAGVAALTGLGTAVAGGAPKQARRFGLLVALMAAVGNWHLVTTRVALRIMLTPLFTTLTLWALVRLVRGSRRTDAILAGLLMGAGVYSYQALRILPLLGLAACTLGYLWRARPAAERRRFASHLFVMALCAVAVGLPLLCYAVTYPDFFWSRVRSNVQGWCVSDPAVPCATPAAALETLGQNLASTALMFTYRGDPSWPYNAPDYPALDPLAGGLFLAGLAGFAVWGVRRRDPVVALVLAAFLIMLLPTVLSVGLPAETPSSNRASGAMPAVYLFVAFGLASLVAAADALPSRALMIAARAAIPFSACIMVAHALLVISGPYALSYQRGWISQREVGQYMRAEIERGSPWGNVYLPYDTFAGFDGWGAMLEAGVRAGQFPDIHASLDLMPEKMYFNWTAPGGSALDPSRDVIFIYSGDDEGVTPTLQSWFPAGAASLVPNSNGREPHDEFTVFRVPALGEAGLIAFFRAHLDASIFEQD